MSPQEVNAAMGESDLAPGVSGWLFDTPEGIYIPVIAAHKPGSGDVSRYLDSLPKDRTVKFPTVLSARLREMLLRRGFVEEQEFAPEFGEMCDIMVRRAPQPEATA